MSTVLTDEQRKAVVSANLKRLVADRGMSQRQLAELTGYGVMTINDAINGKKMPGGGLIANLAEALKTTADEILGTSKKNSRQTA
jgi:transcriptional regulator with XRE-family HTH domain